VKTHDVAVGRYPRRVDGIVGGDEDAMFLSRYDFVTRAREAQGVKLSRWRLRSRSRIVECATPRGVGQPELTSPVTADARDLHLATAMSRGWQEEARGGPREKIG